MLFRSVREVAGLTQCNLATRLRTHNKIVHRSEIKNRGLDSVELAAWCRACDAVPGELIRQIGWPGGPHIDWPELPREAGSR